MSSAPDEVKMRKPDEEPEFELLDAIVEDMLEAIEKKDKKLLKLALESLMEHIQFKDEAQDHQEMFE